MKNKKIGFLLVILAIAVVGVVIYFISRPPPQELLPQTFAELPEKPKLIAEFHHGTTADSDEIAPNAPEGFSLTDTRPIYSVAFSPIDASLIASVNANGSIKLWNINNTKEPIKILRHPGVYPSIGFSPTGELLASAGFGTLILWDVASGMKLDSLETSKRQFAFTPNGHQLATVSNAVKVWDIRNPKKITKIATLPFNEALKATGWACAVDISSDGQLIAAGYANGNVNVWNLKTKELVKTLETGLLEMDFLKFSPNTRFVSVGGKEWKHHGSQGYIMWDLSNWQRHGEVLRGNIDNLVFSPDEKICVSANDQSFSGRGVEFWSVENGEPITFLPTQARDVSFSNDGRILVTGGREGIIQLWELTPQQLELSTNQNDVVKLIFLLPEGKEIPPNLTVKLDKSVREAQDFYADEMERHGFGRKTFSFETDENGKAKVYLIKEDNTKNYDLTNNTWLGVLDDRYEYFSMIWKLDITGLNETFWYPTHGGHTVKDNIWHNEIEGITPGRIVFTSVKDLKREPLAYVLRDAFGLPYDPIQLEPNALKRFFSRINDKMPWGKKWAKLSKCQAEWLYKSRFFNPNQPFFNKPPQMIMNVSLMDATNSRRFQFEIADEDGMHQVQLFIPIDMKNQRWRKKFYDCRALKGKEKASVEFEISDPEIETVVLRMIDMHGNIASREFIIKEKTDEK
ncbi:hypothetical protein C6501_05765 [Candidatus Poribacteria bacterium]|nr:MAG: hypothetical protein C6501_05765 [Candidatus Poribacteria bacterium]